MYKGINEFKKGYQPRAYVIKKMVVHLWQGLKTIFKKSAVMCTADRSENLKLYFEI